MRCRYTRVALVTVLLVGLCCSTSLAADEADDASADEPHEEGTNDDHDDDDASAADDEPPPPPQQRVRKGLGAIISHFVETGERVVPHRAHTFNSLPPVAELQASSPPKVSFKLSNFGQRNRITHLANITFANNGKDRGSVLVGLFGYAVPRLVANFIAMIENSAADRPADRDGHTDPSVKLVGSRCVRFAPQYIIQCGDLGGDDEKESPESLSSLRNDTEYRVDDGIEEANWDAYLKFAASMRSKAALLPDRDEDGTITVEGLDLRELRHQVGTLSMVVRDKQRVGSHFFLSATPTGFEFDGQHVPIGVILSGFTTTLQTALLQRVAIDRTFMAPRRGSEVTISRASFRRFAGKGTTIDFEQRCVAAPEIIARILNDPSNPDPTDPFLAAAQTITPPERRTPAPTQLRDLTAGMNAGRMRGWLLPIPGNVRARIYKTPETEEERRVRKVAEQRAALDSFNTLVRDRGAKDARREMRRRRSRRRPEKRPQLKR